MRHDYIVPPGLHTSRAIGRAPKGMTTQLGSHTRVTEPSQAPRTQNSVRVMVYGPQGVVDETAGIRSDIQRVMPAEQRARREREDVGFAFQRRNWAHV